MKAEGKPLSAGQIADLAGLNRKPVDKAIKVLKESEQIVPPNAAIGNPIDFNKAPQKLSTFGELFITIS